MALHPNLIDVHVGKRLRLRRTLLGMSQEKLGKAINLTFQQIQKYERGANRIGSSRLYALSQALNIPVSYFFEDLPPEICGTTACGVADANFFAFEEDPLVKRETLELVKAYYKIDDSKLRKKVFELVKAVAKPASDGKDNGGD